MSSNSVIPSVKAEYCIFDMDGLLSEYRVLPQWSLTCLIFSLLAAVKSDLKWNTIWPMHFRDSERIYTDVTNEILARYGYEMTWEIKSGLMGKPTRESIEWLFGSLPGLSDHLSVDEYLRERNEKQEALFRKVDPMKGALELVKHLAASGVPVALATGSNYESFKLKTSHLPHLFDHFPVTCILTADSPEVPKGRGKPFPDIFLAAARALGRDVGHAEDDLSEAQVEERKKGLVFEDAVPGVKAGVAAGMGVIWVPDDSLRALAPEEDYGAVAVLRNLEHFRPEDYGLPAMKQD